MPTKLPTLSEPSTELAKLIGELYDSIGLELIYQPVVDLATGQVIDGQQRIKHARANKWKVEPIAVKTTKEQRELLRVALNLQTRPMTRAMTRQLIEWCLTRWHDQTDRSIARTIGKPHANKVVAEVRRSLGNLPQHETRTSGGKAYKASKPPSKLYTKSEREFAHVQGVAEELGDSFPTGKVSRRQANKMFFSYKQEKYAASSPDTTPSNVKITCQDFRDFKGTGFDLVIADPPWGINWSRNRQDFAEKIASVLRPGGFACCWTGDHSMPDFLDAYRAAGLTYRWMMVAVWKDGPAMRNDGVINTGKTPVLILQKGGKFNPYKIFKDVMVSIGTPDNRHHEWQQPLDVMLELVITFSPRRGKVADLTLGSGQSACATILAGNGRTYEGCEIDEKNCKVARRMVFETVNSKVSSSVG
jgi:predicted RNA methylase